MAQITLNINKDKHFLPCYQPYIEDYDYRYNVYYGGRGSGKTIFVFQKLLIKGLKEKRTILLMRKTTNNCKFSVWKELKEAVARLKLTPYFTFYESDYSAVTALLLNALVWILRKRLKVLARLVMCY